MCQIVCLLAAILVAGSTPSESTETFLVDGLARQALIYSSSQPPPVSGAPIVFVFHGHGGNARAAARRFRLHTLWPEAVVVYMQGLPGVEGITDPQGTRNGWQKSPGQLGDRDVRFFDRVFAELQKRHKIDSRHVYVVGHSNGGRFVHVLWKTRGEVITAIGSVSGHGGQLIQSAPLRSVFMVAGERDRLVPYQGQLLSIGLVRSLLKTDQTKATVNGYLRSEPGLNGTELVTYLHPGGHEWPPEVSSLIVEFFKRTSRK